MFWRKESGVMARMIDREKLILWRRIGIIRMGETSFQADIEIERSRWKAAKTHECINSDWKMAPSINILDRALIAFALSYLFHWFSMSVFPSIKSIRSTFFRIDGSTPILRQSDVRRNVSEKSAWLEAKYSVYYSNCDLNWKACSSNRVHE